MALYSRAMDLGLALPTPAHALTEAAEEARETMRRQARARRLERTVSSLVTEHGHTREPDRGPVPKAALATAKLARAHGFDVIERETLTGYAVEGAHEERRVGFRAYWSDGKTDGGTWHELGPDRYTLIDDTRPIGKDKVALVGLKGKRAPGVERVHLKLIATRRGIPFGITEIERRIRA